MTPVIGRREAVRLLAGGVAGLLAWPWLGACGNGSEAESDGTASDDPAPPGPVLAAFDDSQPAGPATGLPRRVAWANTSDSEDFLALGQGMEAAARDRDLEYLTAIANGDPASNVEQMETFLARGVGGITVQPLDQTAQRPVMARALDRGVCVHGIITHPSTLQIAADQYRIGYLQGTGAADHARAHLDGQAQVHYFSSAAISPQLALRRQGVLDGLATGGDGVKVVSDVPPRDRSIEGGFELMNDVLQAHPEIKIVLGSDTFLIGAYRAMEQAGRLADDMYFAGIDGDAAALALIKEDGPYRASQAFAWRLMGYGLAWFTADWIEGGQIPRIMVAESIVVDSPGAVDAFLADNADPAPVFADRQRYERYFPLLGNVGHASRTTIWRKDFVPT